jgi:hypothetical protein
MHKLKYVFCFPARRNAVTRVESFNIQNKFWSSSVTLGVFWIYFLEHGDLTSRPCLRKGGGLAFPAGTDNTIPR